MRKRLLIGASVLAASLVVVGSVFAVASTNITSPQTIKLVTHFEGGAFVDADDDGNFSSGDYFVFTSNVFNRNDTQHIGEIDVQCLFVSDVSTLCTGGLVLFGRGQVTIQVNQLAGAEPAAQGPFTISSHEHPRGFHVAVTGGTHEFSNVHGEAVILPGPGRDTERITLHLSP